MHSRIFALRLVADTKTGDHEKDLKDKWDPITMSTIEEWDCLRVFSDYIDDVADEDWEDDIKWFTENIFGEGNASYKEIDGEWMIKVKIEIIKKLVVDKLTDVKALVDYMGGDDLGNYHKRYKLLSMIDDKFGFHVIDQTGCFDGDVGNIDTSDGWIYEIYQYLTNELGLGLTPDEEIIFRVEGVIDYHY